MSRNRGGKEDDEDDDDPRGFADLFGDDPHTRRISPKKGVVARPEKGKRRAPDAPAAPASTADADEPSHVFRGEVPPQEFHALRMGDTPPATGIDLHGLDRAQAQQHLRKAFGTAMAQGRLCVRVIHGHGARSPTGDATLKASLPGWLRTSPLDAWVRGFAPAPPRLGGEGATLVLLRKRAPGGGRGGRSGREGSRGR